MQYLDTGLVSDLEIHWGAWEAGIRNAPLNILIYKLQGYQALQILKKDGDAFRPFIQNRLREYIEYLEKEIPLRKTVKLLKGSAEC